HLLRRIARAAWHHREFVLRRTRRAGRVHGDGRLAPGADAVRARQKVRRELRAAVFEKEDNHAALTRGRPDSFGGNTDPRLGEAARSRPGYLQPRNQLLAHDSRDRSAQEPPRSRLPVHSHDGLPDAYMARRGEGIEGT